MEETPIYTKILKKLPYIALGAATYTGINLLSNYLTPENTKETTSKKPETQFKRTEQFYTKKNYKKIKNSFIIVVGVGGVGR